MVLPVDLLKWIQSNTEVVVDSGSPTRNLVARYLARQGGMVTYVNGVALMRDSRGSLHRSVVSWQLQKVDEWCKKTYPGTESCRVILENLGEI